MVKTLLYTGPINDTGYGTASIRNIVALSAISEKLGFKLLISVIGDSSNAHKTLLDAGYSIIYPTGYPNFIDLKVYTGPVDMQIVHWHHQEAYKYIYHSAKVKACYTVFELLNFVDREYEFKNLEPFDRIYLTAERFIPEIAHLNKEVKILPHLFNEAWIHQSKNFEQRYGKEELYKTCLINTDKYETRKGTEDIIHFFDSSDYTELTLVCYNPFNVENFPISTLLDLGYSFFNSSVYIKDNKKIILVKNENYLTILTFYYRLQYITASKAEGWGLGAYEALYFKDVLCIHNPDAFPFLDKPGQIPQLTATEQAFDRPFFYGQGYWFPKDEDTESAPILIPKHTNIKTLEEYFFENGVF